MKAIITLTFLLLFIITIPTFATIELPTQPGETYDPEILLPELKEQIKKGAFITALRAVWAAGNDLANDIFITGDVTTFISQWLQRPGNFDWLAKKVYAKWGPDIDQIFHNPNTTDEEKAAQVISLIEADLAPFISEMQGPRNLVAKYAPNFRTYRLDWNRQQQSKTCKKVDVSVKFGLCGSRRCYDQLSRRYVGFGDLYWYYAKKLNISTYYWEPDYKIYRVTNSVDQLISTIKGYQHVTDWFSFGDIWDEVSGNGIEVPENGLVIFDYDSDINHNINTTLAYKIETTTKPYAPWCADSNTSTSILLVDANGDGDPDFVPWHILHEEVLVTLIAVNMLL